jgi:hypothetical protein
MFAGRISWTQYKFRGDKEILSSDRYQALREMTASQLEELLGRIRTDRCKAEIGVKANYRHKGHALYSLGKGLRSSFLL